MLNWKHNSNDVTNVCEINSAGTNKPAKKKLSYLGMLDVQEQKGALTIIVSAFFANISDKE